MRLTALMHRSDDSRPANDDTTWLARAVTLARANVDAGGGPFGAVVVRDGREIGTGQNRVTRDNDPTAHAEVVAIRAACAELGDFSLEGCVLYTSCEPCPLCISAALWARLDRVVYSADRTDAARGGFDDAAFYATLASDRSTWEMTVTEARTPDATVPFDAWLASGDRVDY